MFIGTTLVLIVYILYYIGLTSTLGPSEIITSGNDAPTIAFQKIFGEIGGRLLTIFIIISVLGTTNGFCMAGTRIWYSIAKRDEVKGLDKFKKVDKHDVPVNSLIFTLILAIGYYISIVLALEGKYELIDYSEAYIFLTYFTLFAIYIWVIFSQKELSTIKRYILPILASIFTLAVLYAAISNADAYRHLILNVCMILPGIVLVNLFRKEKTT